jgi:glutathione-independent formaldehyde dehydrogenase
MKALVFDGPCQIDLKTVDMPTIQDSRDAIVRITSSAICGSDLHMYEGRTGVKPGTVLGHENMGVIEEIGSGVTSLKKGDRVVLPFNIACGFCYNCLRGFTSACLTVNPQAPHAAYGYADMGPFPGGQAEYLRVPYADFNALKLPGEPGDEWEDDFLMLADIWPTGYFAADVAGVGPGSTVAVFGAGPVGLMATLSASIMGAAEIYVVDRVPKRLKQAEQLGGIPIDFTKGDPVEQIKEMRSKNTSWLGSLRPGEERMNGVDYGLDCVGYQARNQDDPSHENPMQVLYDLVDVVNPTGSIGMVGVYMPQDPNGVDEQAKQGEFMIPWGKIFNKGLRLGMGQAPVKRYNENLRNMIIAGKAKPSQIVTQRLPLEAGPDAYKNFDQRGGDWIKVVLKPGASADTLVETRPSS